MKTFLTLFLAIATCCVRAALIDTYSFSVNQAVPDADSSGLANTQTISSDGNSIQSISITLQISGGYNGDLYVFLSHGNATSVLVNRVGRTAGNPFGYSDSGFSVTFRDSAVNGDIHNYQVVLGGPAAPLTGDWAPDARTADPGSVLNTDSRSAFLSSFNGMNPNGAWTLFLADLDAGGMSTLQGWDLEITAVPEVVTPALLVFASLFGLVGIVRAIRRR